MNTKIKFGILALAACILLILAAYPATRAVGFPQTAPGNLYPPTLAQVSNPPTPDPVILTDEQDEYPLGLHLGILEDPTGELTIEDVTSPEYAAQFVPSQDEVPNYGFTDSVYWLRLRLDNQTLHTNEWLLEQGFANMHFVDLFTPLPGGDGFAVKQSGVLRPASTRDIQYPNIVFSLTIPPQSQQTYYLRVQNGASMTLPLTLWTQNAFLDRALVEHILKGIFYGVLIGLLFYNLFLLFSLRELNYLFFVFLLTSIIFEDATYSGYLQVYLLPDLGSLIRLMQPFAFPLLIASMVVFADSFLELKKRHRKLHAAISRRPGCLGSANAAHTVHQLSFYCQANGILGYGLPFCGSDRWYRILDRWLPGFPVLRAGLVRSDHQCDLGNHGAIWSDPQHLAQRECLPVGLYVGGSVLVIRPGRPHQPVKGRYGES